MRRRTVVTACSVGLLQTFVPSAELSKTGVIKPRSVGCSVNRTSLQNYLLEKTGVSLLGPAGHCTHTTQAASPSPFSGSPWDVLSSEIAETSWCFQEQLMIANLARQA